MSGVENGEPVDGKEKVEDRDQASWWARLFAGKAGAGDDELREAFEQLQATSERQAAELSELETRLAAERKARATAERSAKSMASSLASAKAAKSSARSELDALKGEMDARLEQVQELEASVNELVAAVEELTRLKAVEAEEHRRQMSEREQHLSSLEQRLAEISDERTASEGDLKERLDAAEEQAFELSASLDHARAEVTRVEATLRARSDALRAAESESHRLQAELSEAQTALSAGEKALSASRAELRALEQREAARSKEAKLELAEARAHADLLSAALDQLLERCFGGRFDLPGRLAFQALTSPSEGESIEGLVERLNRRVVALGLGGEVRIEQRGGELRIEVDGAKRRWLSGWLMAEVEASTGVQRRRVRSEIEGRGLILELAR